MTGLLTPYQYARLSQSDIQAVSDEEAFIVNQDRAEADYNPRHVPALLTEVVHLSSMQGPRCLYLWQRGSQSDHGSKPNSLWANEDGWRLVWQFYFDCGATAYDVNYQH